LQRPRGAHHIPFAVVGARRNGIDRLFLRGRLDRSTVPILESELVNVGHPDGAVVVDLVGLVSIDASGLSTLEEAADRQGPHAGRLSIINGHGPVRAAFEEAGISHLLGGQDLSDLLDAGEGEWSPVSLPPFLGPRVEDRPPVPAEVT
jgi:ABC-type transporter Mla MlaB component